MRSPMRLRAVPELAKACERNSCVTVSRNAPGRSCESSSDCTSAMSAASPPDSTVRKAVRSSGGRSSAAENSALTASQCETLKQLLSSNYACVVRRQFAAQPGTSHGPLALDGGQRNPGDTRRLLERQAAEVAQFDDPALRRIDLVKFRQCRVDGEYIDALVIQCMECLSFIDFDGRLRVVQADFSGSIAAPLRAALPRVVHEHAAHDLRRQREKLLAVLPLEYALPGKPDECFVDQRRALQRVIAALACHLAPREAADVVVDHRPQRVERGGVAVGPALQESRDLAGWWFVLVIGVHEALWRES